MNDNEIYVNNNKMRIITDKNINDVYDEIEKIKKNATSENSNENDAITRYLNLFYTYWPLNILLKLENVVDFVKDNV